MVEWFRVAIILAYLAGLFSWALLKRRLHWLIEMIDFKTEQFFIKSGWISGNFDGVFGKFPEKLKDSDLSIKVTQHPVTIEKCRVVLNKKELLWENGKPTKFIWANSGSNMRIPKTVSEFLPKNTRVELWDGKRIFKNIKFEDLPDVE